MVVIGAHVPSARPLQEAAARGADCVQIFLSNPQSWRRPPARDDAAELAAHDLPVYVHAPYLVNVASANNRVRIPSRKILQETCDAAAAIGAAAVIVHGGHVDAATDLDDGFANWRKALERLETDVLVLIENTAGGQHALSRRFDVIGRLWEHLQGLRIGFCLDTCHAHAAGERLVDAVQRLRGLVGRIDLVHANDSKDEPGCGRDRHANLGSGRIDPELLVAAVAAAGAPVICETPGDARAQANDIAWLRSRLRQARSQSQRPQDYLPR
ncbi:MAG TPA: deoxyribonuclease IV [Egibacteraceae bacterium]|nr:deoxyribonuclease IV [Egibacteraceae bacterium]